MSRSMTDLTSRVSSVLISWRFGLGWSLIAKRQDGESLLVKHPTSLQELIASALESLPQGKTMSPVDSKSLDEDIAETYSMICESIRREMQVSNVSFRDLARAVGTSISQVQRVTSADKGSGAITVDTLLRFARALGMGISVVLRSKYKLPASLPADQPTSGDSK